MVVTHISKQIRTYGALVLVALCFTTPTPSHAGIIASFTGKVKAIFLVPNESVDIQSGDMTDSFPALKPVIVDDEDVNGALVTVTSSSTNFLSATTGSLRVSTEEIDFPTSDIISVYEVKKGDTLITVAKLFGVSKNTITWANDLKSETITPGMTLVILPMTGIKHVVKKGDTIPLIAKKYKADTLDIAKFNGIAPDDKLVLGSTVLVPEGELAVTTTTKTKTGKVIVTERVLDTYTYTTPNGFLIRPLVGGRKTQGLHGHNGIDIASTPGTPVLASASGRVIIAKSGGYNGGYGSLIIIAHDNGVQTVYAHLKSVYVSAGETVTQGRVIGELGNTGRSTGPHLHFEVRGAVNPF